MLIAELKSRRALFRHRPYRLFAASGLAATFGNGLVYIALAWDGWQKSGSLATLAWLMACLWLPTVLLGPLFGVCADRCERKTLLILSNGARGAALIVFAVAALAGAGWPIAVLALTLGVFQAFYFPAALPMVRDMFEPARRLEANATVDILYEFGTIAGMAASGVLIAQAGGGAAFLGGGLCFLAAAALCVPLPASRAAPSPEAGPNPWHDLVAVARYLAHRPQLGSAGLAQALVMILLMTVPVLLVPFASQVLGSFPGLRRSIPSESAWGDCCRRDCAAPCRFGRFCRGRCCCSASRWAFSRCRASWRAPAAGICSLEWEWRRGRSA